MFLHQRSLRLNQSERTALEEARNCHPKPYMRERAAALLLVAAGHSAHHVARHRLLKPRKPDTLYSWLNAYESKGLAGLYQLPRSPGRGFSP